MLLQNDLGAEKWPGDPEKMIAVVDAFKQKQ